ncbi:EAL domain-containing protein [Rhodopirellula sp. JC740]|uniref:EAL domain-containing protein n=1 Tax=Rhodopirellula halodulae TaxID=2894198 RepID=A0ABS8NN14_9BACT|nr:EAL domain-containing protein [Rhodopirellula sp. JC740]MCC9644956.1 EAL domain-containing protein [Rhodopirellula sp. JC740]
MPSEPTIADEVKNAECDPNALLAMVDRMLAQLQDNATDVSTELSVGQTVDAEGDILASLSGMRRLLAEREAELQQMKLHSESMAAAQAEAIVHSAEIIDELEQTKLDLSEARSAAEQAAYDTRRLAETIFERTSDAVLVLENKKCLACNDNAVDLLKVSRHDLLQSRKPWLTRARFEDGSNAMPMIDVCVEDISRSGCQQLECQVTRHDESTFWAELAFSSFESSVGNQVIVMVRDVSARKRFEAELRRHRDFLNNIVGAVPDQLSVRASDQRIVVANEAFLNAHGVTEEQVVGKLPQQINVPSLRDFDPQIDACFQGEVPKSTFVDSWTDEKGQKRFSANRYSAFTEQFSEDRFVIATSRDITEDRDRERRLQLLASVFEEATEGVAILDCRGKVLEANPAFAAMTSIDANSKIAGERFLDLIRSETDDIGVYLAGASKGKSWAGKISLANESTFSPNKRRSFWISLSPGEDASERRIIALITDITELENSQEQLRHRAMHDTLTGCPNRAFFREKISSLVHQDQFSQSSCVAFSVCFLDLDDFKFVNDSVGHAGGDELLKSVAMRIAEVVGPDAFVGRFGGDEFAILMSDEHTDLETQQRLLDELLKEFRRPFELSDFEAHVGLSIGVTRYPQDATQTDTLMGFADIAMYAAKQAGKNAVAYFDPSMQEEVVMRNQVQTQLRTAIDVGDVELHYQPKVNATSRQLVSCEALVRWRDSDGKFVSPQTFIPIAENSGLICALGEHVFEVAVKQALRWNAEGCLVPIAVNVSPIQLRSIDFVETLKRQLDKHNAKPEWFELEITENAIMSNVDHSSAVIDELARMGFRIAIDDFGTGHSSLGYLKSFQVHTLKIDLSFVRDVMVDRFSRSIVRSITSLGHGLGLTVVAEGVETEEQANHLQNLHCDELQGYFFGRPMPETEFNQWRKQSLAQPVTQHINAVRCFEW